ncbi:probable inactive leucine-rich repeat receptor-like protein kinase At3g03770 isoform X2 [Andrographis paniculata]|uniref:probable inactive leucine-rich repeat receptor-like protein kinase At3g03770 isoform X2 n=1 Tax=Andrographis paniculata TaxID=175694 RepID=UPI0021E70C30|nr:probable inactive leucine-rich repeat receptor-like protein kinase At3g03770 isoform X2 [Andrographis paniculata]
MQTGGSSDTFVLVFLSWLFFASETHQLGSYETQVLLQLRKHLEYPSPLNIWDGNGGDFCSVSHSPEMSIKCENGSVTELRIVGNKPSKVSAEFKGYPMTNQTLSPNFSIDSFVTTLARLARLRVLSLVSLGIWGPMPEKIHRLYSLEALDMSSNFIFGSLPSKMSRLVRLRSLTFDGNYFNDTLPDWLDSLTNLTIFSLKNNRLKGQVPSAVSKLSTLTEVVLSHNLLSGKLPDLSGLAYLELLDLRENNLSSKLPSLPNSLTNVFLSGNSFAGNIPQHLAKLNQLQRLDLSGNYLSGTPPTLLFSLPKISYLNLSSNALSGSLPQHLGCGYALSLVDLSNNRFKGELPKCLDAGVDDRIVKFGGNCFSVDAINQHPAAYCKDLDEGGTNSTMKKISILAGIIGGFVVIVVFFLVGGLVFFYKRHYATETFVHHTTPKVKRDDPPSGISQELLANARLISQASKLGNQSFPSYREYSLEELNEATECFDQSNFLGEGSIGKVHKGRLGNGSFIAIRSLALCKKYSIRNLSLQLDLLSKLRHPHLVGLLGHCIESVIQCDSATRRLFLVYEFIPNGDFHSRLSETSPEKVLKWSERLAILIDIAKAVHFLHTGVIPPCLNNQLRTNNILLDEDGIAKLSDYGMSIIADETEQSGVKGDATAKSWHMKQLQDDVYKYGLILLESLVGPGGSERETGEAAYVVNEMRSLSWSSQDGRRKIVDPAVLSSSSEESLRIVLGITNKCISSVRPSFEDVLWNLQYAAQVQSSADSDQKSDAASYHSFG